MKCAVCSQEAQVFLSYTSKVYCRKHFREVVVRRIRKDLRVYQPLDTKRTYYIIGEESAQAAFLREVLTEVFGGILHIADQPGAVPLSCEVLEEVVGRRFEEFLERKENSEIVSPLRTITFEELSALQSIILREPLHPLLALLEETMPGSLFSLAKSLR